MRRVPFLGGRVGAVPPAQAVFGEPQIRIVIEVDQRGLMRTSINKPLAAVQVLGLLLDSMQGQYQAMAQNASMLIDPNKGEPIAGKEEENHNDRGGDSTGGESVSG
jgi:hypothetical protein